VTNDPAGRPEVTLSGEVRRIACELGIERISISITHTANFAIASAVALARSHESR
jgi:phosphopantetheinyl transferase (holo-ACP synthase)